MFRVAWVVISNGFIIANLSSSLWRDYRGDGMSAEGISNVSMAGVALVAVFALGIVLEINRLRAAAFVNVGVYLFLSLAMSLAMAIDAIDPVVDQHDAGLALIFALLMFAIAAANAMLYAGISPLPTAD